ncbi:hypothetical protein L195_g023503 [Trifolium pratense]|uniref:Uncharacterized protein n=1 Tax=Trifolium pratense TaxID=57577 RepID=A0A2K3NB16_TRIPR|nr:hypothetical protein L195_g023503 [Trifolium pratense]
MKTSTTSTDCKRDTRCKCDLFMESIKATIDLIDIKVLLLVCDHIRFPFRKADDSNNEGFDDPCFSILVIGVVGGECRERDVDMNNLFWMSIKSIVTLILSMQRSHLHLASLLQSVEVVDVFIAFFLTASDIN